MKLVVFIQVALLVVQLVNSSCKSTLERCINTDCSGNNTVLEEIKQELCDIQDTECTDNPCKNGGTCINVTDTPVCQCPSEFVGTFCELNCTVEYETVEVSYNFKSALIYNDQKNSTEECASNCTGECTASALIGPFCFLYRAPVFSVTTVPGPIEEAEAACKSTCTSQMNSCRSYLLFGVCYTYTVSATDLPVTSTRGGIDIFNKITKCDISP